MKLNKEKFDNLSDEDIMTVFRKGLEILGEDSPFVYDETLVLITRGEVIDLVSLEDNDGKVSEDFPNRFTFPKPFKSIVSIIVEDDYLQLDSDFKKFNHLAAFNALIEYGVLSQPPG